MAGLRFDPNIEAARRYRGGLTQQDIRARSRVAQIYKLSSNESPLGPSPDVIACIAQHAPNLGTYSPVGDERLREALAQAYGRRLTSQHFVTANGAFELLELIARGFLRPGDSCIICKPTFGVYARTAEIQGATVVDVPLDPKDFSYRVAAILAAIDDTTRVIYLCNPSNPAGSCMPSDAMASLVEGLPEHVLLVADEVYYHFADRADFPDSVPYVQAGHHLIVVRTFSKAYGMAGMRVGYGISTPEIAGYLGGLRRTFHLNSLAFEAAVVALGDQDHVQKTVRFVRRERAWVTKQLQRLGVEVWPSQTNFILFRCPMPAQQLFEELLGYGVIVRPTTMFGLPDCLRVTIGRRAANRAFVEALEALLPSH